VISAEYRELNRLLHESDPAYGSGSGAKYAQFVLETMRRTKSSTVLDYGCGKGTLGKALGASGADGDVIEVLRVGESSAVAKLWHIDESPPPTLHLRQLQTISSQSPSDP